MAITNLPVAVVEELQRQFDLSYFVETGTGGGDTSEIAASRFDKIFTCEIDSELVDVATRLLSSYSNVRIYNKPSVTFLREVKPELDKPTLYWLDAHWCGGKVVPEKECPLLEELAEIGPLLGRSVVMIDDMNMMATPPPPPHDPKQWPDVSQIHAVVDSWDEPVTIRLVGGESTQVMVVTPRIA